MSKTRVFLGMGTPDASHCKVKVKDVKKKALQVKPEKLMIFFMAVAAVMVGPHSAHAITTPVAGSFAYDIYDVGVNDILKGPIGFVAGVGAIVFGAIEAIRKQPILGISSLLGGGILLKADTIVSSLGLLR